MRSANAALIKSGLLFFWASFLAWMLWSGEVYTYIGPRTLWIVPLGILILALVGILEAVEIRHSTRRLSSRELLGLASFLTPMLVLMVIPDPGLGSQAASQKSAGGLVSAAGSLVPTPRAEDQISFPEIAYASDSEDYAASMGIIDGYPIKLTGFVTHPDGSSKESFNLTRFATFCCAADAVPYSVPVDPPGTSAAYVDDTWLTVSGSLIRKGGELVLQAQQITEIEAPDNPYI